MPFIMKMKTKTTERKRLKRKREKYTKWEKYYILGLLAGSILMIFEIQLFRKTIIPLWIPTTVILTIGIISFLFNRTHYNLTNKSNGWFFPLIQNIVSWGFISCYFFMAINFYFADVEQHNSIFKIKSKSSMSGSKGHRSERKPLVTIDYDGFEKVLVFMYEDTEKVDNATQVKLLTRKGLLGLNILDDYEATNDSNW